MSRHNVEINERAEYQVDVSRVLDKIKEIEQVRYDSELEGILQGATSSNVSSWRRRNTLPIDAISEYALRSGRSLDWLLLERGASKAALAGVQEQGGIYVVPTSADAVYKIAADVYLAMQPEGVEISPRKFEQVVRTLHRDMLDRGEETVPPERVAAFLRLAISES